MESTNNVILYDISLLDVTLGQLKLNNKLIKQFFEGNEINVFTYGSLSLNEVSKIADKCNEPVPGIFGKGKALNCRRIYCNSKSGAKSQQDKAIGINSVIVKSPHIERSQNNLTSKNDEMIGGVATLVKDNEDHVLGTVYTFNPSKNMLTFKQIMMREGLHITNSKYIPIIKTIKMQSNNDAVCCDKEVLIFVMPQTKLDDQEFKLARCPTERYKKLVLEQLNQSGWKKIGGKPFMDLPSTGEDYGLLYNRIAY